jgi:hypothetical protein
LERKEVKRRIFPEAMILITHLAVVAMDPVIAIHSINSKKICPFLQTARRTRVTFSADLPLFTFIRKFVLIEPILENDGEQGLRSTGVFKIFKDAFGDETNLFTEPAENEGPADDLPDEQYPDYLGKFVFEDSSVKHFEGQVLSIAEQAHLAIFIETYQEPDI